MNTLNLKTVVKSVVLSLQPIKTSSRTTTKKFRNLKEPVTCTSKTQTTITCTMDFLKIVTMHLSNLSQTTSNKRLLK